MSLLHLLTPGRLAALGCALVLGCGGEPEEEPAAAPAAAPTAPAARPAALGSGGISYPGQRPSAAPVSTDLVAEDPTRALPRPLPNGCDPAQLNPTLVCDRGSVSRWVPRQVPAR